MTKNERIAHLQRLSEKKRREYYGEVAEIGCIICGSVACIHHAYGNRFPSKRAHRPVIPLCYYHHQGDGGIHNGKQSFEDEWGDQEYLLLLTEAKLDGEETAEHTTQ